MPAIHLQDLSLATPDGRDLVSHVTLSFGARRTGLVGRNGSGKTTLLRAILGERAPKAGAVQVEGRLGVLRQTVGTDAGDIATALGIADALARLARIEAGTASDDDHARADWTLAARLPTALAVVGLPALPLDRPIATLSGGQRTRLALAGLLLGQPDILLLDEPTNNLDADGRAAIRDLLRHWHGGAVVVSHDRALLAEMDEIVELTTLGARLYGGNWEVYEGRRALDLAAAEHDLAVADRQLAAIDRKAQARAEQKARADARGRARGARDDLPRIVSHARKGEAEAGGGAQARLAERQRGEAGAALGDARARVEVLQPLAVTLDSARLPPGRTVLQLDDLSGGPEGKPVIRTLFLTLTGPERVAVTGPNGAGKTTLLRLVTGALAPTAGTVRITPRHAMLDQQVSLLDPALSIRDNYRRHNLADSETQCRAALARFRFRAEAALQPVGTLSGGETLRAGLAVTIGAAQPPELLILDEPTNHLDLEAIAAVEAGLRAYDGALLVVSHDEAFLEAIGMERRVELGANSE